MQLRDYQTEAISAVRRELAEKPSTLLVLPTGCGKTVVFSTLAAEWPSPRVLIVAHTEELVNQAASKVKAITGQPACVEQADRRALPLLWGGSKIVVASTATIYRESRLTSGVFANPLEFGLVVFDEAHRYVRKNLMARRIHDHFAQNPDCRFLGVTATPDRTDKGGLTYFKSIINNLPLSRAIHDGWLVPIRQQYARCTQLDFSKVRISAGEYNEADLERVMIEEKALHETAGAILDRCQPDQPTLVFAAGIHHAERLTEILAERHGRKATCVHGGNADYPCPTEWRRQRLAEFARGEHQILIGCDVFYEGFDAPQIANVVIAKKTRSRLRYAQAVGRGTRILPDVRLDPDNSTARRDAIAASAKPFVTIIDLVGASTELELELPCVMDLLVDKPGAAARARAKRKAIEEGGSAQPTEDLAAAEAQLEREAAERARRSKVTAEARFEWTNTGGIGTGDGRYTGPVASTSQARFGVPATPGQVEYLRRNGIDARGMTKGEAGRAINQLKSARHSAPPTEKQRTILSRAGLRAKTREHASALLDLRAQRSWRARQLPTERENWGMDHVGETYQAMCFDGDDWRRIGKPVGSIDDARSYIDRLIAAERATRPAMAAAG